MVLCLTVWISNLINLTSIPILIPIEIIIRSIITPEYAASAAVAFGIMLKSKGKTDSRVRTVASPTAFKMTKIISRSVYQSKIIKIIWPIMVRISVVVRIGSHELISSVKNECLVQVVTPFTVPE